MLPGWVSPLGKSPDIAAIVAVVFLTILIPWHAIAYACTSLDSLQIELITTERH
jgi:hypothetical protein